MRLSNDALRLLGDNILKYPYMSVANIQFFFESLGIRDVKFISRPYYTRECLEIMNGTEKIEACILQYLDPHRFLGNTELLDRVIDELNVELQFEHVIIQRVGPDVQFIDLPKGMFLEKKKSLKSITDKALKTIASVEPDIAKLTVDEKMRNVVMQRISEIARCLEINTPIAVIILCGSVLEGLLNDYAMQYQEIFNKSPRAPKDKDGNLKPLEEWNLRTLVTVARLEGLIKPDVANFSHVLIDFRNYIHPQEQIKEDFEPDEGTAEMCWKVVKNAISQLSKYNNLG